MISTEFSFIDNLTTIQFDQLHALYQQMWWGVGRTNEEILTLLKLSIPFMLIKKDTHELVGLQKIWLQRRFSKSSCDETN